MAKKIGASALNFTLLGNWGTFSKAEYELIRVTDDEFNPIPEIEEYMNEMIQKNTDIKIYFRQEYDYRNYLNQQLENNI